ncbi:AAA family ATPase [Rhizobium mongolense]|uniref:AAA family ATPase n=1 Tax=Rhizobium mongolense TaxID=57676 RepID=UPI0034A4A018
MTQAIVAFLGISGVGKSTFLKDAAQTLSFHHLTADSTIGRAHNAQIAHDRLRLQDIAENQNLLVEGFHMARDVSASIVILDGHAVIDRPGGLETVNGDIFCRLGVNAIATLRQIRSRSLPIGKGWIKSSSSPLGR